MASISLLKWDSRGLLQPYNSNNPTHPSERSPYRVSLIDIIDRFGFSKERLDILSGFINFRSELHSLGLTNGFQWLDGSFFENIEVLETRPPNDIDVTTFLHCPPQLDQGRLYASKPSLFCRDNTKIDYNVDAFFAFLNNNPPELLVAYSAYWYGMWSHRRNDLWKGFIQIDLSPSDDSEAQKHLEVLISQEG